jgi:hypothetical protein
MGCWTMGRGTGSTTGGTPTGRAWGLAAGIAWRTTFLAGNGATTGPEAGL